MLLGALDERRSERLAWRSGRSSPRTALYEPFGLAVLEAAQAGCALVLSDIPTFRELWDGAALFVAAATTPRLCAEAVTGAARTIRLDGVGTASAPRSERARLYDLEASAATRSMALYDGR